VFDVVFAGWFLKMAAGKWRENRREISRFFLFTEPGTR